MKPKRRGGPGSRPVRASGSDAGGVHALLRRHVAATVLPLARRRPPAAAGTGEPPAQARLVRLDEPRPLAVAVVVTARYDAVDDA